MQIRIRRFLPGCTDAGWLRSWWPPGVGSSWCTPRYDRGVLGPTAKSPMLAGTRAMLGKVFRMSCTTGGDARSCCSRIRGPIALMGLNGPADD